MQTASTIIQPIVTEQDCWEPVVGEKIYEFLDRVVPSESKDQVKDSAVSILKQCALPTVSNGHETGLVVGYVQSGKTMSFEAVAALARDNDFHIVVIIAGTSNSLLEQSTNRLRRDFGIDDFLSSSDWIHFENPDDSTIIRQQFRNQLQNWADSRSPANLKKTILITVLKNHNRLFKLAKLFESLNLENLRVLIIDDEADQASLNVNIDQETPSTTYRRLIELRESIPCHTYLQYTATPQAPLLINLIDSLSPNFVQLLEPGSEYVGGREFFGEKLNYIRPIPSEDIPSDPSLTLEPPMSLINALCIFLVGVTAGLVEDSKGNRSMLIHPSHLTADHGQYCSWINSIFGEWRKTFNLSTDDPDRMDLLDLLRIAHKDLAKTLGDSLPAFDQLIQNFDLTFRNTSVVEVNSKTGDTPKWANSYGWILIGGRAMDRGFTVEGLTVTYMPRGIGVGNADTIQQRARFFGYKRKYLGYCRVFLDDQTIRSFQSYVDHEEDIRSQLIENQLKGYSLDEWKRAFVLDKLLKPCRNQVLSLDYMQGNFSDSWQVARTISFNHAVIQFNQQIVLEFIASLNFTPDDSFPMQTKFHMHEICKEVPLADVLEFLLVNLRITDIGDSQRNTGMLLQLSKALEVNPQENCVVYRMSPNQKRSRRVDENGVLINLFQGEHYDPSEEKSRLYPGDRAIRKEDAVSVQIHELEVSRNDGLTVSDVFTIAVWIPRRLSASWVVQEEG